MTVTRTSGTAAHHDVPSGPAYTVVGAAATITARRHPQAAACQPASWFPVLPWVRSRDPHRPQPAACGPRLQPARSPGWSAGVAQARRRIIELNAASFSAVRSIIDAHGTPTTLGIVPL